MENKNSEILNNIVDRYTEEEILIADGLDKAIIGIFNSFAIAFKPLVISDIS